MTEATPEECRQRRRLQRWLRWLSFACVTLTILLVGAVLNELFIDEDPHPPVVAITYTLQEIRTVDLDTGLVYVPVVAGFDGSPAISTHGMLPSTGVRCNITGGEVPALGSSHWERADLEGSRVPVDHDIAITFSEGCVPLRFSNNVPDEVRERVEEAGVPQQWKVTGNVDPVDPKYLTAVWSTEPFWVVP